MGPTIQNILYFITKMVAHILSTSFLFAVIKRISVPAGYGTPRYRNFVGHVKNLFDQLTSLTWYLDLTR